ncbi:MAG: hypothetical protein ACRCSQ_07265 [Bacteroidales bacterium]
MNEIVFSNGLKLDPQELVYVALPPENETDAFNEDVWNYLRKGPAQPTLVRVRAADVKPGEVIYTLDGVERGKRLE